MSPLIYLYCVPLLFSFSFVFFFIAQFLQSRCRVNICTRSCHAFTTGTYAAKSLLQCHITWSLVGNLVLLFTSLQTCQLPVLGSAHHPMKWDARALASTSSFDVPGSREE